MGTYRALLVCFLLLGSACAQEARQDQFKVEGVVVNSLSGKPLSRALVQLNMHSLLTGAEGEFSFEGVPPGSAYITLTKPGYFGPGALPRGRTADSMIEVGPDTGKLVLKMAPEAVIFGHVTGQDGDPLEAASVQLLTLSSVEGRRILTRTRNEVRTDEDGNFRIASLPSGRYYLAVKAGTVTRRVLGAQTAKNSEAYPALIFHPGTADVAAAAAIDLAPGQKMEAQFSLALTPAYKLAGKVVAAGEWKHINMPTIIDSLGQPLLNPEQFDAAAGSFEFRAVPAGTYTVRLGGSDLHDRQRFFDQKITVSKNTLDARLVLLPGLDIPVITRLELSKPRQTGTCTWGVPGGPDRHSDCTDYPAANVELISVDSVRQVSSEYRPLDDASSFAVHGVTPGRYMVRVRPTLNGYVQAVRSGNVDLLREVLTIPESGSVAPIEIVLRDDVGTIKTSVRSEKPGQPADILIFLEGALFPTAQQTGHTNSDMWFQVPPGRYNVLAFDSLNGVDYENPQILTQYGSKLASVTVAADGVASVAVELIHVGE
jgi:hypothetical protein